MISLFKNAKCISQLNIHYYPNRRYKPYVTFLRAVIVGKTLISAGLDIDRILHFIFYDKIPQISRQHWVRRFYRRHTLSKCRQISKKWGEGGRVLQPPHPRLTHPCIQPEMKLIAAVILLRSFLQK